MFRRFLFLFFTLFATYSAANRSPFLRGTHTEVYSQLALLVKNGSFVPGVGFSAADAFNDYLLGADFGLLLDSSDGFQARVPTLASGSYVLKEQNSARYSIGLNIGPVFGIGRGVTSVEWALLLKPAARWALKPSILLEFEFRMGLLGSSFAFMPHIGIGILL